MQNDQTVKKFTTSGGKTIYKLPVMAFPGHVTHCYLALDDALTLIDTGSSMPQSNESLESCIATVRDDFGEKFNLADVDRVIITHGHVDHFGGLNYVVEKSNAEVGVHELDKTTLTSYQARQIVASKNLDIFLARSGLEAKKVDELVEMNKYSKHLFHAVEVDFTIDEGPLPGNNFVVRHTPGHCPGEICLRWDDVLFVGDHVLARITPNQSPEFITRYNGLGHYIESLRDVRDMPDIRLALGGHETEIHDLPRRVDEIIEFHERRLDRVLAICETPKPIAQISKELFPKVDGYHVLLALLEAGAHVEYLYERGKLEVGNIEEVEREANPVLLYERA